MKKITLTLLTLIMVMPSLVCSVSLCPMKAAQAAEIGASTNAAMPCHEQAKDIKSDTDTVMLMTDCMGVDLQKAATAQIDIPAFTSHLIIYPAFTEIAANQLNYMNSNSIRGSPPQPDITAISAPTYHTTQRFRI